MFKKALKMIHKEFSKEKLTWAVIGSTNMKLQGINIQPNDLDIIVKLSDLKKIAVIFKKYHSENKIEKAKTKTGETIYRINVEIAKTNIEIVGERDSGIYSRGLLSNQIIKIKLGDIEIPCFTLEAEEKAYLLRKRFNRAKIIRDFLTNKAYSYTNPA